MKISRFGFHTALLCITLIAVFVFSGYNHSVEIQDRLLCHALGIDFSEGEFEVSVQAFKPSGAGSDTPVDITKSNIELVYGKGRTVSEALEECENQRGKEIFLGHLQLISLGSGVDLGQPEQLFEFCLKDRTVYLGVDICLSKTTASELMEVELSNDMLATENYIDVIEKNAEKSRTVRCRLLDLLNLQPQGCALLPVLSVKKPPEDKKELSEPVLTISETAVIKDGRALDETLSAEDIGAFCMLCGGGKQADLVLEEGGKSFSISIGKQSGKACAEQGDGILLYKARLTVVVHRLRDVEGSPEPETVSELVKDRLQIQLEKLFKKRVNEQKDDIFGLWKLVRQKYPGTFLKYEGELEKLYAAAEADLEIRCLVE